MSKYDKELDTRTKEYEKAMTPAPRDPQKQEPKRAPETSKRKK